MAPPDRRPRVSAILVSYNTRNLLLEALGSLPPPATVEVVVVDNASADGSADAVAHHFSHARVVRHTENRGFAAGVNAGVAAASGERLLLLNPDARLEPGALDRLVATLDERPRAAAVGPALRYPDGRPQESAFAFPGIAQTWLDLFPVPRLMSGRLNGRYPPCDEPYVVDVLLGACLLLRRAAWDDVGPFDEGYFMYVEEVDWFRRARLRGWKAVHDPRASAIHVGGSATRQRADAMYVHLWRGRLRYFARYHGAGVNRLLRAIVRLGMAAEARRARARLTGEPRESRLGAIETIRSLAS